MKYFLSLFLCGSLFTFGQQLTPSTNYLQNIAEYNPAYLGRDYTFRIHAQHTQIFYNHAHRPIRQFFMYEQHFDSMNTAIGIQVDQFTSGIARHRNFLFASRYEWRLSNDFSLLVGLSGGVSSLQFDDVTVHYPTPAPDYIGTREYQPVINAGLAAAWRMFTFGYSARQLNRPYFEKSSNQMTIQHALFGRLCIPNQSKTDPAHHVSCDCAQWILHHPTCCSYGLSSSVFCADRKQKYRRSSHQCGHHP